MELSHTRTFAAVARSALAALLFLTAACGPTLLPGESSDGGAPELDAGSPRAACPCGPGYACTSGACELVASIGCGAGFTLCQGVGYPVCARLSTDKLHCGKCSQACAGDQECLDGVCKSCGLGAACCTGGRCFAGLRCSGATGRCVCDAVSCSAGCCGPKGCAPGTSSTSCGAGGAACLSCGGTGCDAGRCHPASMTTYVARHAVAYGIDHKVYVFGGIVPGFGDTSKYVFALDTATNTWSQGPMMAAPLGETFATVAPDGTIWVIDGAGSTLRSFRPGTGWGASVAVPLPRTLFAFGVAQDGRVYVTGGNTSSATNYVDIYDPSNGSWSKGPDLPAPRRLHVHVRGDDGRFYVLGGINQNTGAAEFSVYVLSVDKASWVLVTATGPGAYVDGTSSGDGRLVVFDDRFSKELSLFDPKPPYATTRFSLPGSDVAATTQPDAGVWMSLFVDNDGFADTRFFDPRSGGVW